MVVPMPRHNWIVLCPLDQAGNGESGLSVILLFVERTCFVNRRVISLVRQSLILPSASDTICRFIRDSVEWPNGIVSYNRVTARITAMVFQHQSRNRCRLVVFDTISRHHQSFSIDTPYSHGDQIRWPLMVHDRDAARARINVVFFTRSQAIEDVANGANAGGYYNIYDCSYEFPVSSGDQAAVVKATSWESLSVPINGRGFFHSRVNPAVAFLDGHDIDDHLAVSFDRKRNTWRVDTARSWLDRFRSTADGAKYLGAMESFEALSPPPESRYWNDSPYLRYFDKIPRFHFGGALLCGSTSGLLQRSIEPPSLKRIAAEAFCRANPNVDFCKLKNVLEFDLFDGIFDGKEAPLINL